MPIDMSQFHQAFFEESLDGLNAMENGLLALSQGAEDPDLIHSVFRAAHSIKGGSGTFGFTDISACAHRVEQGLGRRFQGRRESLASPISAPARIASSSCWTACAPGAARPTRQ